MNKTELIETIAQRTDLSKKDVQSVLDTFEDIAGDIVAKGKDTLTIPGFLKFEQTHRAAGEDAPIAAQVTRPRSIADIAVERPGDVDRVAVQAFGDQHGGRF